LTAGDRPGARREDLRDQLDLRGIAGAGDQHVMTGGDREAGQDRADLAGAEDPEGAMDACAHTPSNTDGRSGIPERDRPRPRPRRRAAQVPETFTCQSTPKRSFAWP